MKNRKFYKTLIKNIKRHFTFKINKHYWRWAFRNIRDVIVYTIFPLSLIIWLFINRQYFYSALFSMYLFLFNLSYIESKVDIYFSNIPNWSNIRTVVWIGVLLSLAAVYVIFEAIVANEGFQPEIYLNEYIPEQTKRGTSVQILPVELNNNSDPYYISIRPSSDSHINLKVYDPDNQLVMKISNYHLLRMRRKHVTTITYLVYKLCVIKSGTYKIHINQKDANDGAVTLKLLKTNWVQFMKIDYSNCH